MYLIYYHIYIIIKLFQIFTSDLKLRFQIFRVLKSELIEWPGFLRPSKHILSIIRYWAFRTRLQWVSFLAARQNRFGSFTLGTVDVFIEPPRTITKRVRKYKRIKTKTVRSRSEPTFVGCNGRNYVRRNFATNNFTPCVRFLSLACGSTWREDAVYTCTNYRLTAVRTATEAETVRPGCWNAEKWVCEKKKNTENNRSFRTTNVYG